jgi:hypothetical protein
VAASDVGDPRIRAMKEHYGGEEFENRAKLMLDGLSKTNAYKIVTSGIAEPEVLTQIWERVQAEAHAARVLAKSYSYPGLNTMIGWANAPNMTDEEQPILAEVEPHWIGDRLVQQIAALAEQGKLIATIDEHGAPFRFVRNVSRHTRRPDTLVLWLDPQGVNDDLETPMPD